MDTTVNGVDDQLAASIATAMGEGASERHRGVVPLDGKFVVFGNDNAKDARTVNEQSGIREALEAKGFHVSGYGESADRYSWSMIFCREGGRADDDENLLVANQLLVDHAVSAGFLNAPAQDRLHKSLPYAVISKFAKSDEAATVTEDDVALMREYVALLKEAKELAQWHPDESDVKELAGYVADLKESAELSASTA